LKSARNADYWLRIARTGWARGIAQSQISVAGDDDCIDFFLRYYLACCDCPSPAMRTSRDLRAALVALLAILRDPNAPEDAILFVEFLIALGISGSRIRFVSFDDSPRSRPLAKWKSALKLNWRHTIDTLKCSRPESEAIRGWLGIRPIFEDNFDQKLEGEGMYGFRFLMTTSAILTPIDL
jgi:hypothetical protein